MDRLKSFLGTSLLGGLTVLLPIGIFVAVGAWVFGLLKAMVRPFSDLLIAHTSLREIFAVVIVLAIMTATCFLTGAVVKTQAGRFLHDTVEDKLLTALPGYKLIKETVLQFVGKNASPFASVALVRVYGDMLMTAFVTEEHDNGWFSVFVPTGPNPTSGNIFHLPPDRVETLEVSVEETMRSVIACGAGSSALLSARRATVAQDEARTDRAGADRAAAAAATVPLVAEADARDQRRDDEKRDRAG